MRNARALAARRVAAGLLSLLAAWPAAGETAFRATEAGLPLRLTGATVLEGVAPLPLPADGEAFLRLEAGGGSWERRTAVLAWNAQGRPILVNDHTRRALLGTLVPGLGTVLSGRPLHGATEMAAVGYLAANGLHARSLADDALNASDHLEELYRLETDPGERLLLRHEADLAHERWEHRDRQERLELALAGAFAGMAVVESWWLNRPLAAARRGDDLVLSVPRTSSTKALLASLVMPGMGQAYRGQRRGALYLAAETFLLQELIDVTTRRKIQVSEYSAAHSYLGQDGYSAADERILQRLWDRQADTTQELQAFTAAAGAVWLLSVVDVLATSPTAPPPPRWAVAHDPGGRLALACSPAGRLGLAWTLRF
ncbi:MAG: hypothetical protein JW819_07685 [Candidatus Krumholzibacteriota bacterium]|nr:hypothetical protein [Candidatus Krumholzibacteriota bacterium]